MVKRLEAELLTGGSVTVAINKAVCVPPGLGPSVTSVDRDLP